MIHLVPFGYIFVYIDKKHKKVYKLSKQEYKKAQTEIPNKEGTLMTNKDILEMENDNIKEQLLEKVSGGATLENLGPYPWDNKLIVGRWYESEYDKKCIYYLKAQLSDTEYLFLRWISVRSTFSEKWVGPFDQTCAGSGMNEVPYRSSFPTVP